MVTISSFLRSSLCFLSVYSSTRFATFFVSFSISLLNSALTPCSNIKALMSLSESFFLAIILRTSPSASLSSCGYFLILTRSLSPSFAPLSHLFGIKTSSLMRFSIGIRKPFFPLLSSVPTSSVIALSLMFTTKPSGPFSQSGMGIKATSAISPSMASFMCFLAMKTSLSKASLLRKPKPPFALCISPVITFFFVFDFLLISPPKARP